MRNDHTSSSCAEFPVAAGLQLQIEHLTQWAKVLNANAFHHLYQQATKDNHKARNGYDICRGDQLREIVSRLMYA